MTKSISAKLSKAETQTEIDDIYRPFRPKRRTRASIAKEKGLEPLAEYIFGQAFFVPLEEYAAPFVDTEKGVSSIEDAIAGAKDILAEQISDDSDLRKLLRDEITKFGNLTAKRTQEQPENTVYQTYYDYTEPLPKTAGHRILAVNRGEKENILSVKIEIDEQKLLSLFRMSYHQKEQSRKNIVTRNHCRQLQTSACTISLEREIRNELTERAEETAMDVFRENLKQLLLQPPIKGKTVLAFRPCLSYWL